MQLESLSLRLQTWGTNTGRYTGTVVFSGSHGETTLNLNADLTDKILTVVAEQIVVSAKEVAENLIIEAMQPLVLEDASEGEVSE